MAATCDHWVDRVYDVETLDKGKIYSSSGMVGDIITLLSLAHDLKLVDYLFLEFHHLVFSDHHWLHVTESMVSKTIDKGGDDYSACRTLGIFQLF